MLISVSILTLFVLIDYNYLLGSEVVLINNEAVSSNKDIYLDDDYVISIGKVNFILKRNPSYTPNNCSPPELNKDNHNIKSNLTEYQEDGLDTTFDIIPNLNTPKPGISSNKIIQSATLKSALKTPTTRINTKTAPKTVSFHNFGEKNCIEYDKNTGRLFSTKKTLFNICSDVQQTKMTKSPLFSWSKIPTLLPVPLHNAGILKMNTPNKEIKEFTSTNIQSDNKNNIDEIFQKEMTKKSIGQNDCPVFSNDNSETIQTKKLSNTSKVDMKTVNFEIKKRKMQTPKSDYVKNVDSGLAKPGSD